MRDIKIALVSASKIIDVPEGLQSSNIIIAMKPLVASDLNSLIGKFYNDQQDIFIERDNTPAVHEELPPPLTILVAEDNLANVMVIKGFLKKLGQRATFVKNGREAINLFHHHNITSQSKNILSNHTRTPFDIIFMDCEMPSLNGYEASKEIRQLEAQKDASPVKIIALTAHVLKEQIDACFAAGMDDYITKPIEMTQLKRALQETKQTEEIEP